MYAGVTRVHELQIISAEGGWDVVEEELGRQSDSLVGAHGWLSGTGYYELGEVRRLRGDRDGARAAYDRARSFGLDPQPGAALLRRAAGDAEGALAELRVSLAEREPARPGGACSCRPSTWRWRPVTRRTPPRLTAELAATADFYGTPGLVARAAQARAAGAPRRR